MSKGIVVVACLLFPVIGCFCLMRKKKTVWISFLIGALCFFLSQIIIRIPLLSLLQSNVSFHLWAWVNPFLYLLFLAATAGIFEELARYIGFRCSHKHHDSLADALAFGFGHGGIEALLIVLLPVLQIDAIPVSQAFLAGIERVIAILAHVGFSVFVWYGVHERKICYLGYAIILHTLLDMVTGLPFSIYGIEICLAIVTTLLWLLCYYFIIRKVRKCEKAI